MMAIVKSIEKYSLFMQVKEILFALFVFAQIIRELEIERKKRREET